MGKRELKNLIEIENKETFIRLHERATDILSIIEQSDRLLRMNLAIINGLQASGVSFFMLNRMLLEHVSVLYRSMFQNSNWEDSSIRYWIHPSAYNLSDELLIAHDEIITHVDKVLAHQDIDCGSRRYLYPPDIADSNGIISYSFCNWIKFTHETVRTNVLPMIPAIQLAFMAKFSEPLLLSEELYGKTNYG